MNIRRRTTYFLALAIAAGVFAIGCSAPSASKSLTVDAAQADAIRANIADQYDRQAARGEAATVAEQAKREAIAAAEAARVAAEHTLAQQVADQQVAADAARLAAEQAASDRAAADQAAAAEAARVSAAVEQEPQASGDDGSNGWYDGRGWVSPETAARAIAAGISPGADVPGYLRCGTICGEEPTSGEVQQQYFEEELARQGKTYEQWNAEQQAAYEQTPEGMSSCPYVDTLGQCHDTQSAAAQASQDDFAARYGG